MAEKGDDLLLINAPPYVEVRDLLEKLEPYEEVVPSDLFAKNPSIGLRDIGLKVIHHIQKGRKVVVLDGNERRRVRESYIKLLGKKCTGARVKVISVIPKFGCTQLLWIQEHKLAENAHSQTSPICIADSHILKWFQTETDININYRVGVVDAVKESEGCSVETHVVDISPKSIYKWEVPGLLIQWEVVCEGNSKQASHLTDVLYKWSDCYPNGRIILIGDGNRIKTGEKSKHQEILEIKTTALKLCQQFTGSVVYVYHIDDPNQAGIFVQPPRPGILAYLQARHGLDLHSKGTVYLYETSDHMKMAENAGVRHLKGSKALKNPVLVTSQSAATIPPIPDMLKSLHLTAHTDSSHLPRIPLFDQKEHYNDSMIALSVGNGRTEYVFVKEWKTFERLQDIHVKCSTKVGETGSKMSPEITVQSEGFIPFTSDLNQSKASTLSRDLPKWMLSKEGSNKSSKSSIDSISVSEGVDKDNSKSRKTVYMMTDHELVETAMDVLKQAGKTDVINIFKSKNESRGDGKVDRCIAKEKTSSKKRHSTVSPAKRQKLNESSSSLCPKIEPDLEKIDNKRKQGRAASKTNQQTQDANASNKHRPQRRTRFKDNHKSRHARLDNVTLDKGGMAKGSHELSDLDDSQAESVECLSTESSQDDLDSSDLDSDTEEKLPVHDQGSVGGEDKLSDERHGERPGTMKSQTDNPKELFKKSEISKPSPKNSPGKRSIRSRRPDLSILDEIFN